MVYGEVDALYALSCLYSTIPIPSNEQFFQVMWSTTCIYIWAALKIQRAVLQVCMQHDDIVHTLHYLIISY